FFGQRIPCYCIKTSLILEMQQLLKLVFVLLLCVSGSRPFQPTEEHKYCSRPGDCAAQVECCVKSRERPGVRYCSTMLELDDVCTPVLIPGLDFSCPCTPGLTCAKTDDDDKENSQYKCIPVPIIEDERD
ncbi:unnamed protein product, partial [Porites evermanni]